MRGLKWAGVAMIMLYVVAWWLAIFGIIPRMANKDSLLAVACALYCVGDFFGE